MRKVLCVIALLAILFIVCVVEVFAGARNEAVVSPTKNGALMVMDGSLCDQAGNPVQLRGVSTHGLSWYPEYVNEACFSDLHSWGANVVRLALYPGEAGGYCSGGDQTALKELIRKGVEYAANEDLYVIIDWHILSEGNPRLRQTQAIAFFDEMSKEFASCNNVLYEICNEPNGCSWQDIKTYAEAVIPVIRANDPFAVILVGTPNWSQEVGEPLADPITGYSNIMYTLHFYAATHKEDLRAKMTTASKAGLPVFVSEFGICDASGNGAIDKGSADAWVIAMDDCGVSYVNWNLSNKAETSAILKSDCGKTSGFAKEDLSESGEWLYDQLQSHNP